MRRAAIVTFTPADASATDTERAAPPAPRIVARMPGSFIAVVSGARNPVTSVLKPSHLPPSRRSVLTD
ncbi:hypothetical protein D3C83_162070 [compost metagenome]